MLVDVVPEAAEATLHYAAEIAASYNQPGLQATSYHLLAQLWDGQGDYTIMEQMLKQASLIIADTNLDDAALAYLGGTFVEQPLFVDTVSAAKAIRIKPYLDTVHTLKASRMEAEALSGMSARLKKNLPGIANWFHDRGVERIFITLGTDGVFCSSAGEQGLEKAGKTADGVANASGAGDAFLAGIAYSWLQHWPLVKSARFAISAANVALSHRSTINPGMSAAAVNRIYAAQYAE